MYNNARQRLLVNKLFEEVTEGNVDNEEAEEFIVGMKNRFDSKIALTANQITKLEELFEQY